MGYPNTTPTYLRVGLARPLPARRHDHAPTPPVPSRVAMLPAALVPDEHLRAVLEAAIERPGSSLDALRLEARLSRGPFVAAALALKARGLLRIPHRTVGGCSRARAYPTPGAAGRLAGAGRTGPDAPAEASQGGAA